jgi:hypothetical protein
MFVCVLLGMILHGLKHVAGSEQIGAIDYDVVYFSDFSF